jgi:hypothetical protein
MKVDAPRLCYWSVTSGGCYPHWRDRFYPHRLPQSQWLSFYAQILATQPLKQGKPLGDKLRLCAICQYFSYKSFLYGQDLAN